MSYNPIIKFLLVGLLITMQLLSVFVFGVLVKLFILLHIFSYESLLNIFCDAFTLLRGQHVHNPTVMLASVAYGAFLFGYFIEKKFYESITQEAIKTVCIYASFIWLFIGAYLVYRAYFNITLLFWLMFFGSIIFYYFITSYFLSQGIQYKKSGKTLLSSDS